MAEPLTERKVIKTFPSSREMMQWLADDDAQAELKAEMIALYGPHGCDLNLADRQVEIYPKS